MDFVDKYNELRVNIPSEMWQLEKRESNKLENLNETHIPCKPKLFIVFWGLEEIESEELRESKLKE